MKGHGKTVYKLGLGAIPILKLRESLLEDSQLNNNYLMLTVTSCLLATLGLIINSAAVIIGAMIIAPLMLPLRGFAFGTLEGDLELFYKSFLSILVSTIVAVLCASLVGAAIGVPQFGSEILGRTEPTLIDLLIAILAGSISGYSKIRPQIGDALPGTAIAVALMPPLCVVGLALSESSWQMASGAALLYLTNLIGINIACLVVYVIGGYAKGNDLARTISWWISICLMGMLVIPLGISFWRLIRRSQIQDSITKNLVNNSFKNRRDVDVQNANINWRKDPPVVKVKIRATKTIEPQEIRTIEKSLEKELSQPFKVILDITPMNIIEYKETEEDD